MVSDAEKIARERDDESLTVREVAERLAPELNRTIGTVIGYLNAKRAGKSSSFQYSFCKKLEEHKTTIGVHNFYARNNGYADFSDYQDHLALEKGLFNDSEYRDFNKKREKGICTTVEEYVEQKIISNGRLRNSVDVDPFYLDSNFSKETNYDDVEERELLNGEVRLLLNGLKPRLKKVVELRFFENQTLESVGKELSLSRERVRQLELKAKEKLYFLAKSFGVYDLFVGEV